MVDYCDAICCVKLSANFVEYSHKVLVVVVAITHARTADFSKRTLALVPKELMVGEDVPYLPKYKI